MGEIIRLEFEALVRTRRRFKTNLVRLRRTKLQHGDCQLSQARQGGLTRQLSSVRSDLQEVIAKYTALAATNEEVSRYVALARGALKDCNEMLSLLQ